MESPICKHQTPKGSHLKAPAIEKANEADILSIDYQAKANTAGPGRALRPSEKAGPIKNKIQNAVMRIALLNEDLKKKKKDHSYIIKVYLEWTNIYIILYLHDGS